MAYIKDTEGNTYGLMESDPDAKYKGDIKEDMSEDKQYTLTEAHQEFAKRTNHRVWELLEKPTRTAERGRAGYYCKCIPLSLDPGRRCS